MGKILITGSTDGLGQMAARELIDRGHEVYLHARNDRRAADARTALPGAAGVLTGDLADLEATRQLAADANQTGTFDTIIHNAAVYRTDGRTIADVNVLSPYLLTCLIHRPRQLIYLSSNDHTWGKWKPEELGRSSPDLTYADSKLLIAAFALAISRRWPDTRSNAIDPGWVPTKMGGSSAPDDLEQGYATQVWLADGKADGKITGRYLYHRGDGKLRPEAAEEEKQDSLLECCRRATGVDLPLD